jgi:hypothetical protein
MVKVDLYELFPLDFRWIDLLFFKVSINFMFPDE